jgi:hypothetical protein
MLGIRFDIEENGRFPDRNMPVLKHIQVFREV